MLAQSPTGTGERKWYDTLTVTQPRVATITEAERAALIAYTAVAIPTALAIGALTVLPPSIVVLSEDGVARGGAALNTGVGFGVGDRDTALLTWYPLARLQLEGAWIPERDRAFLLRSTLLYDVRFTPIGRRKLLDLGASIGLGAATDFSMLSPFVEASVGLSNPFGIRFIPFNPGHHYGLRARIGYDLHGGRSWHELAFCASSTFAL